MENKTQIVNSYPGLATLLTAIFAAGKVFGYLNWSWLWVFSPIIASVGLIVLILLILSVLGLIAYFLSGGKND